MTKWARAGEIILIIYLIICTVASGLWIYLKFFVPERKTELITYLSTVEDLTGKKCVVQASLYENNDNSGQALLDIKLNGYSDTNAKNIVSFGIQVIGDFNNLEYVNGKSKATDHNAIGMVTEYSYYYSFIEGNTGKANSKANKLCFYEESDELSYKNVNSSFNDFGSIRVNINDKMYAFAFGCDISLDSQILWWKNKTISSLSLFVKNIYEQLKTAPIGHSCHTFGFKDMLKVYEVKNGVYEDITVQDEIYNYCYIDFNHYTTGAKTATDSLFKQVNYNLNWVSNSDSSLLDNHFSDKSIYYLTEKNCKFEYDTTVNKHMFDITKACYDNYKDKKLNYKLVIDLDYLNSINIAFGGLKNNSYVKQLGLTKYYTVSNGVITEVAI